jgi:hypothetical protein
VARCSKTPWMRVHRKVREDIGEYINAHSI